MNSMLLTKRCKEFPSSIAIRIFTRFMGGGPRTFPGGINKWQWKRLHERKAREKEKRLLDQEKEIYMARIRSELRASLTAQPTENQRGQHHPVTSKKHVKMLADRFMKEGAEDLWNENDGPLYSSVPKPKARATEMPPRSVSSPVDLRKMFNERRSLAGSLNGGANASWNDGSTNSRNYFTVSGSSDGNGNVSELWKSKRLFNEHVNEENMSFGDQKSPRDIGSSAALGKHDVKLTKRRPLKKIEDEILSQEVELIRRQHEERKLVKDDKENNDASTDADALSLLSEKRFEDTGISPFTIKALTAAGYERLTRVQAASLSVCLEGKDALVKAKSGTGKTAAFLIPAIEAVLTPPTTDYNQRLHPIYALILCPTRELASQIAAEAIAMLKYHEGISVKTLVGGTRFKDDLKSLKDNPCQIIVATPGRLLDHIENKGGLSVQLMSLKLLILDEADHLLDLGFRTDIEKIVDCLPRQRQSLLFTATVSKEVRRISQLALKREHEFIDVIGHGSFETHDKVKQSFVVTPSESHFKVVYSLLKKHILRTPNYKVIIFCTTGMVTSLMYSFLHHLKMNVIEIHPRKPHIYRIRVSEEFRNANQMILATSDVSTRGMNYPDVTLVIQVGIPFDREHYVHRVGRTGRAGKFGEAILVLSPWEEYFLDSVKDLPLQKHHPIEIDEEIHSKVDLSMSMIDRSAKEAAYHGWLGYYNSIRELGRDKTTLVEHAMKFCHSIGLEKPPPLFRKTALKMGLKNIPGIRLR